MNLLAAPEEEGEEEEEVEGEEGEGKRRNCCNQQFN